MRVVIQRVKKASVTVAGGLVSEIEHGLLILVGIKNDDSEEGIERLAKKIITLRIFEDENHKMNLNIQRVNGSILSVPQFTLYADTHKGNRPGFEFAANPQMAKDYWKKFNQALREYKIDVKEGMFGAHMQVGLLNDGPVTIILDSQEKAN